MKELKLACIGGGNMGTAFLEGLTRSGALSPRRIVVTDPKPHSREELARRLGIRQSGDNRAAVRGALVVVLAVKPQILAKVLTEIKGGLAPQALVLSLAAGYPTGLIERLLTGKPRVVRAMPNIAASVGLAATGICPGRFARRRDLQRARWLLKQLGTVTEVDEGLMDAVTGLSGTGPMYVFIIIEALSDAGVRVGLARAEATQLAIQTVLGAATMVRDTGEHPIYLKDKVTSPAGTAINALYSMEKTGLRAVLMDAVEAATRRSRELGQPFVDQENGR